MNGGYKMVSLKDHNFTPNVGATIKGIYDSIENNYRKNILLTDIVINSIERTERFITFGHTSNYYEGYMAISDNVNYRIRITDEDVVTIYEE